MEKIFGIPATELSITLTSLVLIFGIIISFLAIRKPILFKMGTRNIPRRKNQSLLIIVGLMLSTIIISTSLGIGDTVRHSIRYVSIDYLGNIDQIVKGPGKQLFGIEYITNDDFLEIYKVASKEEKIDGIMPNIEIRLPVSNPEKDEADPQMRIRGFDYDYIDGFNLKNMDGENISTDNLSSSEVFINEEVNKNIGAEKNSNIAIYFPNGRYEFKVIDIVKNGGLSGGGGRSVIIFDLNVLQSLLMQPNSMTSVYISNVGGVEDSVEYSDEITKKLRLEFTKYQTAQAILDVIKDDQIRKIIKDESNELLSTSKELSESLLIISEESSKSEPSDEFINKISDSINLFTIISLLEENNKSEEGFLLLKYSNDLVIYRVDDEKKWSLDLAEAVASGITTIFSIFGSFSIMVGLLLIFLVFVLLASARSVELGMARAVGLKRQHLIQLFTYEGTIYAFIAALAGTVIGILLSFGIILIVQDLIDTDDFTIRPKFTFISALISFSAGMTLTFITVIISAYRVSNLNIVVAIRGLKEEFVKEKNITIRNKFINFVSSLFLPISLIYQSVINKKYIYRNILLVILFTLGIFVNIPFIAGNLPTPIVIFLRIPLIVWPIWIIFHLYKLFDRYIVFVIFILSIGLIFYSLSSMTYASFIVGCSLLLLCLGYVIKFILNKFISNSENSSQISGTIQSGLLLAFLFLPFEFFTPITGDLSQPGPWFWPLSGAAQTASAVWLLMSNSRILVSILNFFLSPFSGLKAVTKTAISYPMASKFRTGLTISMFALIIFTLVIFSILNNIGDVATEQPDRVTGGFDILGTIDDELPIDNIENDLDSNNILMVAKSSNVKIDAKESKGYTNTTYKPANMIFVDENFMMNNKWKFKYFDTNYGANEKEIWEIASKNDNLIIANANILEDDGPFGPPDRSFKTSMVDDDITDKYLEAFNVNVKLRGNEDTGQEKIVIAIIESLANSLDFNSSSSFYISMTAAESFIGTTPPVNKYYFKLSDKTQASRIAKNLQNQFLANGMNAISLYDQIVTNRKNQNAFNKLFQGFSSLGLVVGVAAIGVLTVRAVVERRQSIGVLRAIGFRSSMIRTQFLIESTFVTFLGVILGVLLGTWQSWNIFLEITKEIEGASFVFPWLNIGIFVGITILASIVASIIPSNEASKIYPAEALRYE